MSDGPPRTRFGLASEALVVALAMRGDRDAFTELVRRRQSWLRNLLRRLCRDPTLADDLAQQALLRAWRALPTLESLCAFGAWLRRLAINTWLAHLRTAAPPMLPLEGIEVGMPDPAHATTGQLDLDHALEQLSPEERLCIVLAYAEGMSHSEITVATGLPLGTVKSHIRRGTERLRPLLSAYRPNGADDHGG